MVFRKPYAFLIKHFRLIHLIITAILGYFLYQNRKIYVFLSMCIKGTGNKYSAMDYINYQIYIFILLAIILMFVVYWLLKYKDKPRKIYIFSIVLYVVIGIVLFATYGYMSTFINEVINQKTIRLFRDVLFISMVFQYYVVIVMFIRGLGFDIKKFNFSKDVQELGIVDEDGEEIEINTSVDTTNIMRGIRKQRREFGYFFKEYKLYIIPIILAILIFLGYRGYNYVKVKFMVYGQNEYVGMVNYIKITDSYYKIENGNNYVVVKCEMFRNIKQDKFNVNSLVLNVGKNNYSVNKNICYKFNDLGNCYRQQYINKNKSSYIFVFEVDDISLNNSYILYDESFDNTYKIKLKMVNY